MAWPRSLLKRLGAAIVRAFEAEERRKERLLNPLRIDWTNARARRFRVASQLLVPVFFVSLVLGFALPQPIGGVFFFTSPLWLVAACALRFRGARHGAQPAEVWLSKDDRPPIVYFRQFRDDRAAARVRFGVVGTDWANSRIGLMTEEEQLAIVMMEFGPIVALATGGLPHAGAARMEVPDSEWKARVRELVDQASVAIIRVGLTEHVQWETELSLSILGPTRCLFVLPAKIAPGDYDRWSERYLGAPIQRVPKGTRYVMLDENRLPIPLKSKAAGEPLHRTLEPFLSANRMVPGESHWLRRAGVYVAFLMMWFACLAFLVVVFLIWLEFRSRSV